MVVVVVVVLPIPSQQLFDSNVIIKFETIAVFVRHYYIYDKKREPEYLYVILLS